MDSSPNHARLFRALLFCFPAAFRDEYGPEMEQLFADRLQTEPPVRLWLETLADVALSAAREHAGILMADLRYAVRVLAAAPGFTAIALIVLALGIGSATAVFSLVNAVLLRSLPYGHPASLVYLWSPNPRFQGVPQEMAPNVPDFYDWQRLSRSFSRIAMLRQRDMTLVSNGASLRIEAAAVTGNFFETMEASAERGRTIAAADDQPGHEFVAVIGHRLWQSQFGSDPRILGKRIQLNRERYQVIGIMPDEFGYPFEGDIPYGHSGFKQTSVWLPLGLTGAQKTDRVNFASADAAIGRLRAGVSPAAAENELKLLESRLGPLYPQMWRGWTALVRPLVATILGPVEQMLWLLLGAVTLVLLIAIANVANLLFARATARAHEIGLRTALGAGRGRIVRQLLTESILLSVMGGDLGIALAYAAVHLLVRLGSALEPGDIPRLDTAAVDARVLFVAVALSIAAGLAAGLAPTLFASRAGIQGLLQSGGQRGSLGSSHRGRSILLVAEVALSVVLLAGAGLLIRSYLQIQRVDPGFSPGSLTFSLNLDESYSTPELRAAFLQTYLHRLRAIHGVTFAGASSSLPLSHQESVTFAEIRGFGKSNRVVEGRDVTPEYLQALGTPVLLGRGFTAADTAAKPMPIIVNQAFTATYLKGRNPLGAQVRLGMEDAFAAPWSVIVGVAGNISHNRLDEASEPQVFQPVESGSRFALQSRAPIADVAAQARQALRSMDPALTLDGVSTMSERMDESSARRRFQTFLMSGFGALAIALALVGLYGIVSYSVKERTAEIGIRLALGSPRSRVVSLLLWQGLRLAAVGLAIGLGGSFALTRLVSGWLYGVSALDPMTFAGVPLFVLAVTCIACLIPAWSATRIDPVAALRRE